MLGAKPNLQWAGLEFFAGGEGAVGKIIPHSYNCLERAMLPKVRLFSHDSCQILLCVHVKVLHREKPKNGSIAKVVRMCVLG